MDPGSPAASKGKARYARIVTVSLLALGIGAAALVVLRHHRGGAKAPAALEAMFDRMGIEQDLMRQLARSKNRHFSDEQALAFKKDLSARKGERVSIECSMDDLKSCCLALELNLIFEASGWIVEEFLFAARPTPGEALILRANDASQTGRAEFLARLFRSAGLSVTTEIDGSQLFDLRIVVPSKGPPTGQDAPA
jgi:hypothetical protein